MGFGSASRAQQQATQQAMLIQAIANQQQQQATRQAEATSRQDLGAARAASEQALREARQRGEEALRQGQERSAGALQEYYRRGIGFQQPYLGAGEGAVNRLSELFGAGGEYTRQPTQAELEMDPGYAFRFAEGQRALQNTLGASGMRQSGAALRAGTRFGQESGSQEYQNAYARFMANRAAATQGLQNLAAGGLSAAGTATGLAGQTGRSMSDVFGTTGTNLANLYTGTGANMANAALSTGQQLGANVMTTGQRMAEQQGQLGQALGQGYANIGNIQAQQAMAPINALASLGGQALQAGAMAYGAGGLGSPFPASYRQSIYGRR